MTNLVSNTGVIASDVTGVGTAATAPGACEYGEDKGIFLSGSTGGAFGYLAASNLVSNTGVVASDTSFTAIARSSPAACGYGGDKGIMTYGYTGEQFYPDYFATETNLISNVGVVGTGISLVGTARSSVGATQYDSDKGIIGFGYNHGGTWNMTNLVSNAGVVSSDVTGVGTARNKLAACSFN